MQIQGNKNLVVYVDTSTPPPPAIKFQKHSNPGKQYNPGSPSFQAGFIPCLIDILEPGTQSYFQKCS